MRIYAKTLTGKVIELEISSLDTIGEVKTKIYENEGIPTELQRLVYEGKTIDDEVTIQECQVQEDGSFQLIALTDNK